MKKHINRREFLKTSSLAAAGLVVANGVGPFVQNAGATMLAGAPLGMQNQPWYDSTKRWIQLVLTEGDTDQYDPQWWLDLFKRAHVQGLCLVAGGVNAFYPTKIKYHPKASFMKDGQDMFGDIVRPAQKMGITIVARTDAQACLNEAAAAHPEWLNIDENGNPRKHKSFLDTRTVTCAYGDYNFKYMTGIHEEIMEMYGVDGLFCNRWQGWARGMCYCPTCRKLFREFSKGMELPRKHEQTKELLKYYEWETQRLTELWHLWDGKIRAINPRSRYFSNVGIDIDRAAELAPTYMSETQSRGQNPPWHVGWQGKKTQAIFGYDKRIIALVGMTLSERHSVTPEAEVKMWLLSAVTNGLSPWLIKSSLRNWDNRWIPAVEKVYNWHYANEKYLDNQKNLAKVGMLFRKDNPRNPLLGTGASTSVGGDRDIDPEGRRLNPVFPVNDNKEAEGIYQTLIESRIPFDWAYNGKLDQANLDRFKVLILPNASSLTDDECEKIRQYVHRGGSVIATYETSLYNNGKQRSNFGLADLLGIDYAGSSESNGPNGYIRLEHETKHPVLKGLEDTQQIVTTRNRANVKATTSFAASPLTRIPTYPTDPMEQIYPRIPKTDIPEIYMHNVGRGRVIYFPGNIGTTFAQNMAPDLTLLMNNVVQWAMNGEPQPATVSGPGILEVTCWEQTGSMTVHLLNCTNPFMLRSAYREDIPVGSQLVTIQVPENRTVQGVKLLSNGAKANFSQIGSRMLIVTVPTVVDHEVVAIDFA
ncbi:alpha-amylase family protein [Bacteroides sp. 51]|uniref:alpha-amylase family protein n=1 Tax=Bacteroides sp. 51 TaxID=2302938 RepID=UPI0013D6C069|nr:alpha-amylase family protein [Bacteroides sp. 51]NDV81569.1 twin-arginine translocation signal domain-containing protein [Bacteroides sp. 51]